MTADPFAETSVSAGIGSVGYITERENAFVLESPTGDANVTITVPDPGDDAIARYSIAVDNCPVLEDSGLGLSLVEGGRLADGDYEIAETRATAIEDSWEPVWGEWDTIPDVYNQLAVRLEERSERNRNIGLVFRAYDEGIAFRYYLPADDATEISLEDEHTEFAVPREATLYGSWQESEYQRIDPTDVAVRGPHGDRVDRAEAPVTLETDDGHWASIMEANVDDYPRMTLVGLEGGNAGLRADITEPIKENRDHRPESEKAADTKHVRVEPPFGTPWRLILVGTSPTDLMRADYHMATLNEPNAIDDPSWISPGKGLVARTTTTAGAKAYVDTASDLGFEWLIWDGPEAYYDSDQWDSDADATSARDGFDVPEIVEYADRHGINIMFYLQHFYVQRNREAILDQFEEWGVHGIKIGFVNSGSQEWTNWHRETVRMAAEREIHVDIHDQHRPDGFSRTYPNFVAIEGGRGDEWTSDYPPNQDSIWGRSMANHNVELPFTRNLLGPFDYTYNYMPDGDLQLTVKHAHKLAQSVVNFHPYTDFFRRDRSGQLVDLDDPMGRLTGLRFWKDMPTTWDDTKILAGRMSELVSVARRSGDEWYVGTINDDTSRQVEISLDFLDTGWSYDAFVYEHDPNAETRDDVRERRLTVTSEDALTAALESGSGQAVRLVPVE